MMIATRAKTTRVFIDILKMRGKRAAQTLAPVNRKVNEEFLLDDSRAAGDDTTPVGRICRLPAPRMSQTFAASRTSSTGRPMPSDLLATARGFAKLDLRGLPCEPTAALCRPFPSFGS